MKLIILSAFSGRLKSEPMEWPDEPPSIRMQFAKHVDERWYRMGKDIPNLEGQITLSGVFYHTGKYEVLGETRRSAAVYELGDL